MIFCTHIDIIIIHLYHCAITGPTWFSISKTTKLGASFPSPSSKRSTRTNMCTWLWHQITLLQPSKKLLKTNQTSKRAMNAFNAIWFFVRMKLRQIYLAKMTMRLRTNTCHLHGGTVVLNFAGFMTRRNQPLWIKSGNCMHWSWLGSGQPMRY